MAACCNYDLFFTSFGASVRRCADACFCIGACFDCLQTTPSPPCSPSTARRPAALRRPQLPQQPLRQQRQQARPRSNSWRLAAAVVAAAMAGAAVRSLLLALAPRQGWAAPTTSRRRPSWQQPLPRSSACSGSPATSLWRGRRARTAELSAGQAAATVPPPSHALAARQHFCYWRTPVVLPSPQAAASWQKSALQMLRPPPLLL